MGERTGISWCDHTHNFWIGCTSVSPACAFCYARTLVNGRMAGNFDDRRRTVPSNWIKPLAWNRAAEREGKRRRVFSLSLGDFFDNQIDPQWRFDAWDLIRVTPWLDWLLLTKRPQNIAKMLPADWGDGWRNVWFGTTVENQEEADRRIPHLLAVPAMVRFLSCEPLLEGLDLRQWLTAPMPDGNPAWYNSGLLHWIICGGESGPNSRAMKPEWATSLLRQCLAFGVPFFMKQVGSRHNGWPPGITGKGDDSLQWPASYRLQQFPATHDA